MRTPEQVIHLICQTVTTVTTHAIPPGFQCLVTGMDHISAPGALIQEVQEQRILCGIRFPEWYWSRLSDGGIAAGVCVELSNYFHRDLTGPEKKMRAEIEKLPAKLTDEERFQGSLGIRMRHEREHHIPILQLKRKLPADQDAFEWLCKTGHDRSSLAQFLLLLEEALPLRFTDQAVIALRREAYEIRIQHNRLLRDGNENGAEALRDQVSKRIEKLLTKTPTPTV